MVKDPVARRFFHLTEESWWILSHLEGGVETTALRRAFERHFPPQVLSLRDLEASLAQFHQQGLVTIVADGQDAALWSRAREERQQAFWRQVLNPLAIRWPGIDPDRWLQRAQPWTAWFWHPLAVGCQAAWILSALILGLTHAPEIVRRSGDSIPYLSGGGLLLLPLAIAISKVLHELGHALLCRRLGAECHELGVLLLVFTPCLYCDVTEAWMLPDKWRRAAVGAAGVWVDLLIAATAGWLWWFSQPGLFQAICGSLVLVCSVATLAFNANPLMQYDGYYVLSDLLEIPNLSQRSGAALNHWVSRLAGSDPAPLPGTWRTQLGLVLYAISAWIWRLVLVVTILWLVARTLAPAGLEGGAVVLGGLLLAGMVAGPVRRFLQKAKLPMNARGSRWRPVWLGGALLGLLLAILWIPWPHRERTPALIEPAGAVSLYVSVPGTLVRTLPAGRAVEAGEEIALLENLELRREVDRLRSDVARQELQLENLRRRQGGDPQAAAAIPAAEESLAASVTRLERRLTEESRLVLRAPRAGIILPPPVVNPRSDAGTLPPWSGDPLEPRNLGAHLETGTLVCQVGDPESVSARLLIDQRQLEFVAPGQTVELMLDQSPWRRWSGVIAEISQVELSEVPPALARDAELPVRIDERGIARPAGTLYQARVTLPPASHPVLLRQTGRARIRTAGVSLWRRATRLLGETFGLEGWRRS